MSEKCFRCGKFLPDRFTMTIGGPPGSKHNDLGWHWVNPAPHATATAASSPMVPVCNECDPTPILIPRAQHEALMAAAKALETEHDFDDSEVDSCPWCKALAALRAAGILEK